MSSWLQKQKKVDLVELADEAGLKGVKDLRKDELATALDDHLRANASKLTKNSAFDSYYNRANSPLKKEVAAAASNVASAAAPVVAAADAEVKAVKQKARRATKSAAEFAADAEARTAAAVQRTPSAVQRVASRVPLPPSPAVVSNMVERQTRGITRRVNKFLAASGVSSHVSTLRTSLSTVVAIQTAFILLEAWGLQRATLPWRVAFGVPVPSVPGLTSGKPYAVSFPDFFVLLTGSFWGPTTLWLVTSLLVPLTAGWFFNLTQGAGKKRSNSYEVDPLVFNVAKALVSWLVFSQGVHFGLFSYSTVRIVNAALPGGWWGSTLGSGVGALVSLYEAALKH